MNNTCFLKRVLNAFSKSIGAYLPAQTTRADMDETLRYLKGGYLDFSHLIELKLYISLKFIWKKKKKNKSSVIKNH